MCLLVVAACALAGCASQRPALAPSVVRVETSRAAGSGFFVTSALVATSAHVVAGDGTATLVLGPGVREVGRVVLVDRARDVALVRSPVAGQPLSCREAAARSGERVTAIGFAPGRPAAVASSGTVRSVLDAMIIHDAALAAGSSGGPLVDADGRVLGLNAIASRGGAAGAALDRGLAVKIRAVVDGLVAVGEPR